MKNVGLDRNENEEKPKVILKLHLLNKIYFFEYTVIVDLLENLLLTKPTD